MLPEIKGALIKSGELKSCSICIYDETVPSISFDSEGICNYCKQIENLNKTYQTGRPIGKKNFKRIISEIKKAGLNKEYDCIIGVSGGTDSSYLLFLMKSLGLRILAVHYDNTWNTAIATENIRKVLEKLDIDLHTHIVDNKEIDDIFRSFVLSGVPELDASTDLGYAETLYRIADRYGIKYVMEGHSFLTEGLSPLGSVYFDGAYIKDIHSKYGNLPMKTYPLMDFKSFIKWVVFKRIRKIRPFWYINYSKESAQVFLERECGWKYYGGHHLENRLTRFNHSVWYPQRFGMDLRNQPLCALIRLGKMTREKALIEYSKPIKVDEDFISFVKKRLYLSDEEYQKSITADLKSYRDYNTYKKRFELLRPFFYLLAKLNLVPMSFYMKYCLKNDS